MIQRKQSLLMALVIILMGVAIWYFPLYTIGEETAFASQSWPFAGAVVLSFLLAFYALSQFKDRKKQFIINRLNMLLNLALTVYLVYTLFSYEAGAIKTGTGAIFPMISVVLLAVANRYIMKDERLVKSADRIR
ncbi:MAG: DUF4293 domain-containing protein [Cryomorphaceae bacterium]|nr:DUF4293 domain-containing protein [Cryomorphaceae bacterium]